MKIKIALLSALILLLPAVAGAGQDYVPSRHFVGEKYESLDGIWELLDLDIEYMQLFVNTIEHLDPVKYHQAQGVLDDYYSALASANKEMLSFLVPYLSPIDFFQIDTENYQIIDLKNEEYDALASVFQIENIRDFNSDSYLSFRVRNRGNVVGYWTVTVVDEINIAITFFPDALTDRDYVVRCFYRRMR